ncbi:precorrin-2 C(20)-methyltransferase [Cryptosporangium aurantiacum]|uniref:Precorrin-2/cobalt-factor-2 C20-methyltransferase n=1 Tax=Cryptosporangium aurantiacum TaxID=134849 RepID=A0A1M7Q8V9_9ACTN|nr:precorrin-2 C(20)-methyltransferase [Cryptosporangium aurantiacum]SHN27101.1 precorrin-2/cobalt-factor-2 C20-methyltransferase [Cryptosporangium aurantiacum]
MKLIGVGVGPGDPELVTVKAVRMMRAADRVYVPVLSADETGYAEITVRTHVDHDRVERLVFAPPASPDDPDTASEAVARYLHALGPGGSVVFATIGDPNVYSPFTTLAQSVRAMLPDVTVETVPGVTAAQDLASRSRVPLVDGGESLTLLPLGAGVHGLSDVLDRPGSVVVYKSGRHLIGVKEAVRRAGRLHGALYGARLGLPGEVLRPLASADGNTAPYLSSVLVPARRSVVRSGDR